jgi:hypothetical protein
MRDGSLIDNEVLCRVIDREFSICEQQRSEQWKHSVIGDDLRSINDSKPIQITRERLQVDNLAVRKHCLCSGRLLQTKSLNFWAWYDKATVERRVDPDA